MSEIAAEILSGFDDDRCSEKIWNELLQQSSINNVFLTKRWLQAWWETLGEGKLLLVVAMRDEKLVAIAPLYTIEGMVYFLGAGEADYHDFIGRVDAPDGLTNLLSMAKANTPNFLGFKFHLIPDRSRTAEALRIASSRLGMELIYEADLPSVAIELSSDPDAIRRAVNRGMLRREKNCRRNGILNIHHLHRFESIRPYLDEFYLQHQLRWNKDGITSQYENPRQRAFLERFLWSADSQDWVRFMRIEWNGQSIGFEFCWKYCGRYYAGPWSYSLEHSSRSPGQILMRNSLLSAIEDGISLYDLGAGDQEYKRRLPHTINMCQTWGLYP